MIVYPNPTNNFITITYNINNNNAKVGIELYDLNGKKVDNIFNGVKNSGEHKLKYNLSRLPSGVYFVRFESDNSIVHEKLIKE